MLIRVSISRPLCKRRAALLLFSLMFSFAVVRSFIYRADIGFDVAVRDGRVGYSLPLFRGGASSTSFAVLWFPHWISWIILSHRHSRRFNRWTSQYISRETVSTSFPNSRTGSSIIFFNGRRTSHRRWLFHFWLHSTTYNVDWSTPGSTVIIPGDIYGLPRGV